MQVPAMSINVGSRFYHRPSLAIVLTRPWLSCNRSDRLLVSPERPVYRFALNKDSKTRSLDLGFLRQVCVEDNSSRAFATHASVAKSGQRTSWDEAADAYFSETNEKECSSSARKNAREGEPKGRAGGGRRFSDSKEEKTQLGTGDSSSSDSWERSENEAFGRRSKTTSIGPRSSEGARRTGPASSGREFNGGVSGGVNRWGSSADREWKDYGKKSGPNEGAKSGKVPQWQKPPFGEREGKPARGERNGANQWQRPVGVSRFREEGGYNNRNGSPNRTRSQNSESVRNQEGLGSRAWEASGSTTGWDDEEELGADERGGFGDHRRWQPREFSSLLEVEGQAVYGTAPIISALQACRRTFYSLYIQENLLQNLEKGKRKDKASVSFIEKTAQSLGLTVKEASKHDLNMLVDNRPHQGLVLDASPLQMVPVDTLDRPLYQEGKAPVWVALDEVTDPQNLGAILRSAYFLGAEGVVVCAKNSAPLSGVVSKASAGAMEVMEVQFCKNMVKFLDKSRENGWRIVGASAEPVSVPVRDLPPGIATILVLGSEGRGMRTNIKRACDHLVSIPGILKAHRQPNNDFTDDFVGQDSEGGQPKDDPIANFVAEDSEEGQMELEEEDEEEVRRGAELRLMSGPLAVDSLNVSVATGIMLYELLGNSNRMKL